MRKDASFLTEKFNEPVIGDSMILYKKVIQRPSGKLVSTYDRKYVYKIGVPAKPKYPAQPAYGGVCNSGMHVGSLNFARSWHASRKLYRGSKYVIIACQVKIKDMITCDSESKVRCKEILPLGIVQAHITRT